MDAERDRRISEFRRCLDDLSRDNSVYRDSLMVIRPGNITPELFADIQAKADDLFESFDRLMKSIRRMWELTEPAWWSDSEAPRIPMDD